MTPAPIDVAALRRLLDDYSASGRSSASIRTTPSAAANSASRSSTAVVDMEKSK